MLVARNSRPTAHRLLRLWFGLLGVCLSLPVSPGRASAQLHPADEVNRLGHLTLDELMEIRVEVGERGPGRDRLKSPAEVYVITAAQIEASGYAELGKVLQRFLPAVNFGRAIVADGTDHVRPFTLRGMGPDQVLVLINGKRRHRSALLHVNDSLGRGASSVDLNAIPLRAIARIEVLRDGAAAQYGTDAIAAIINIVLKSNLDSSLVGSWGLTAEGDGLVSQLVASYGLRLREDGFLRLTVEWRDRGSTNRAGPDTRQQYFDGDPRNDAPDLEDQVTFRSGDPDTQNLSVMFNGELPVSNRLGDLRLYTFGGFNYRQSVAGGFFRRPQDDRTVRSIYPRGFLPLIAPEIWDGSLTVGGKGEPRPGWTWDLSNSSGANLFRFLVKDSLNASMGDTSPTSFDSGKLVLFQSTTNLDLYAPLEVGLHSPLRLGAGLEHRHEYYRIHSGEAASYSHGGVNVLDGPNSGELTEAGAQVFPGFRPENATKASRDSLGVYLDLGNDLTDQLLLSLAGRWEYYDDFGHTVNGKLSTAYEPVQRLVLRASTGTGFRAPSMAQSHFTSTASVFTENEWAQVGTFPVDHELVKALGGSKLKPEKSFHLGAGASFRPIEQLVITAGYFFIAVQDRIVLSGNILADASVYGQEVASLLVSHNVGGARFFNNAVDTQTQGADISATFESKLGRATRLTLTGLYHANFTNIVGKVRAPAILGDKGPEIMLDRRERMRFEHLQPRHNLILTAIFQYRDLDFMFKVLRFGSVVEVNMLADPSQDQTFSAKWLADIEVTYKLTDQMELAIGAHNLLDSYPDLHYDRDTAFYGEDKIFQYPRASPFGSNGGFYYGRITHAF